MSTDDREIQDRAVSGGERPIELSVELQREMVAFARTLPVGSHYVALGVRRDAAPERIREAFSERSRRFHPDRFFGRNLGGFEPLLHQIYKRVVVAYEVLREPESRARYDRSLDTAQLGPCGPSGTCREAGSEPVGSLRSRVRRLGNSVLSDLRARVGSGRRRRGRPFAAAPVRPAKPEPRGAAEAEGDDAGGSLAALVEAAELHPDDAELACRVAEQILDTGRQLDRALHFAERAVALEGNCARHHQTVGRIHSATGRREQARRALLLALELDPEDSELAKTLEKL